MSLESVQGERSPALAVRPEETAPGLLAAAMDAVAGQTAASIALERFLAEASPLRALALWSGCSLQSLADCRAAILPRLHRDIARIDALLNAQVNALLHHERFQRLEASWRGLRYLVEQADGAEGVKVRVLSATWKDLARDFERAIEFDQSSFFRKVYSEEFDTPGGEPFGLLLGDFEVWPRPAAEHPYDDMAVLAALSQVAAAAFAPFVAGVHPAMFGLDDFSELEQALNLPRTFDQLEYLKWKSFRDSEDSRFVGLVLPRVLTRLPYEDDSSRVDGFRFHEETGAPGCREYAWGNAVYAFGAVAVRAFAESGWLATIGGVRPGLLTGGLVAGLPAHSFATDKSQIAVKCSTDVLLDDYKEQELGELGFVPLCHCADTEFSAFYTSPSTQKPRKYDEPAATTNARISAMLQYVLCVSRFAHYLKVVARDKLGSFSDAAACEDYLHRWIHQYVVADSTASMEVKAAYPLREAGIRVRESPAKPGSYHCTAHLWPHFELDGLTASIRVTAELAPAHSP
jgi:type VI secretion system protein ImpD